MERKDHFVFPAIFDLEGYEEHGAIHVEFPDFPDCVTCGENEQEALELARERLTIEIRDYKQEGKVIPKPTPLSRLKLGKDQVVKLVEVTVNKDDRGDHK